MNCSDAEQFFDAYLDGELAGSLRLEFDAHRLRCTACQQKLAMMEACEHILSGESRGPLLSPDFTNKVMNEIRQRRFAEARRPRRRLVWAAAAAVQAAAVIVFAFLWVNYWNKPVSPVLPPGANPALNARIDSAISNKDRVELTRIMTERFEELQAAKLNIGNEVRTLAGYVPSLWNLGDWTQASGGNPGLFELINSIFLPLPPDNAAPPTSPETGPQPDASGIYSL